MPNQKPFTLNDETVKNSYGFYVLTAGIDLSRFLKNPVMLGDHSNKNADVLGKWENIIIEEGLLLANPIFFEGDKRSKSTKEKVEQDFIKGASMGLLFDPKNLELIDGKLILTKCELTEASIVPVPSNKNALRLYNENGEALSYEAVESMCLSMQENTQTNKQKNVMKKVILSVATLSTLGLENTSAEGVEVSQIDTKVAELNTKITNLQTQNQALKDINKDMKDAAEAKLKTQADALVLEGKKAGKYGQEKVESFTKLAMSDLQAAKEIIDALPAKQNFSSQVTGATTSVDVNAMTMENFQKLNTQAQLSFKNENPEAYKLMLTKN